MELEKSVGKSLRYLAYKRFTSSVCPASGEALSGSLLPAPSSPHPPPSKIPFLARPFPNKAFSSSAEAPFCSASSMSL